MEVRFEVAEKYLLQSEGNCLRSDAQLRILRKVRGEVFTVHFAGAHEGTMRDAQCLELGGVRRGGIPPHVVPAFPQVDGEPSEGIEVPIHGHGGEQQPHELHYSI